MFRFPTFFLSLNLVFGIDKPHLGHMKPFGHPDAGNRILVEETTGFLPPSKFFSDFVEPLRPLIFRGGYNETRAFRLWEDGYLKNLKDPDHTTVVVESAKKEIRDQQLYAIPLDFFFDHYTELPVYLVHKCPAHLRPDTPIPGSIQCPELFPFFSSNQIWMSSGGTSGFVHTDLFDNINCVVRGYKQFVIVDPRKFPLLKLDDKKGTFFTWDVDAVNFTENPQIASVTEFYFANVSAGDCLYIPFNFIHQVRSFERNIAVNVFWKREAVEQANLTACSGVKSMNQSLTFADVVLDEERVGGLKEFVGKVVDDHDQLTLQTYWESHMTDTFADRYILEDAPADLEARAFSLFRQRVFERLDRDRDGEIVDEELEKLNEEDWRELERGFADVEEVVDEAVELKKRTEMLDKNEEEEEGKKMKEEL